MRILFPALILMTALHSQAEIAPKRRISDVNQDSKVTDVQRVLTAHVVMADYDLLKRDFPRLASMTNDQIDAWLLENTALMSSTQVAQSEVNTPIHADPQHRKAFRPPKYNRALVFQVQGGLIDGKGYGSENPAQEDHGNGLATTGEMVREFLYQKLIQKIFDFSGSGRRTVANYAVIDWGFRITHADGTGSPAGAVLRQAHRRAVQPVARADYMSDDLDKADTIAVELLLRKFGVTSAGAYRDEPTEYLNVQGTDDGAVLDFGGFLAVDHFSKPAHLFYETENVIVPGTAGFVEPDASVRVPMNLWGSTVSHVEDPKQDNPWIWSHELAEAYASGRATRAAFDQHLHNFLDPIDREFKTHGPMTAPGAHPLCQSVFN